MAEVTTSVYLPIRVNRFLAENKVDFVYNPTSLFEIFTTVDVPAQVLWFKKVLRCRALIGHLWLKNEELEAKQSKKWVLCVYGTMHMEDLRALAEKLSKEFNVDLHIRLEDEDHHFVESGFD